MKQMLTLNFLIVFWIFFFLQNRVIRISKGLFGEDYSIKEFTFDPNFEYQSFKLTAELHLTRKGNFFILDILKLIKKLYDNLSKTLFIPYPIFYDKLKARLNSVSTQVSRDLHRKVHQL